MESIDSTKNLLKTSLYDWHQQHRAQMAAFGDYLLPLWYEHAKAEHLGVIQAAGLFDTGHMAEILVSGPDAFELLQWCCSRDLSRCFGKDHNPLPAGRGAYSVFLNQDGHLIDDAIIFRLAETIFFVCVNAGKGKIVADHLQTETGGKDVTINDLTGRIAKMDLQGPESVRILHRVLKHPEAVFDTFAPFAIKGALKVLGAKNPSVQTTSGIPLLISRSGYTGEFGFELFLMVEHALELWEMLINKGSASNLIPCGLAARDSLRTGAGLPLSGHDIGPWPFENNPWLFALPYADNNHAAFTKPFVGSQALATPPNLSYTAPFAGFDLRKVEAGHAVVQDAAGKEIGKVLTCVTDMAIDRVNGTIVSVASPDLPDGFTPKGLCCGFVKTATPLKFGDMVELKDPHRTLKVEIVADIRPHRSARLPLKNFL